MTKGKRIMNYLKIENGRGFFISKNNEWTEIDKINKDDILFLLERATDDGVSFEMSEYKEEEIKNEADKIIYKNIYTKFQHIVDNKTQFLDESDSLFKDAFHKYDNHLIQNKSDFKCSGESDLKQYKIN